MILLVIVQNLGMKMKRKEIMETMRLMKKRLVNILLTLSRTVTSNHVKDAKRRKERQKEKVVTEKKTFSVGQRNRRRIVWT